MPSISNLAAFPIEGKSTKLLMMANASIYTYYLFYNLAFSANPLPGTACCCCRGSKAANL
jgi:hypothetical protein